ncbi:unnamed protein product [Closterium sp. NIES-53]
MLVTMVGAVGDAGVVDTLETRLADARRRHADCKYEETLPLEVVQLGIRTKSAAEHPSQPASPRPVNNEGGVDQGVNASDQVDSSAGGTSRQREVLRTANGEVGSVQARGMQSSAAAGSSQGNVGGRRSSVTLASATHVIVGGIASTYGYFKFPPDKITVIPLLVGRHDLLTWKEAIKPQMEMAGLMCFADGTVETPSESDAELCADFRAM